MGCPFIVQVSLGAKFGKAVAKVTDDLEELLAFYPTGGGLKPPVIWPPQIAGQGAR